MSNHYEELMHFVTGNTRDVVCRNWANDLRKLDGIKRQRDKLREARDGGNPATTAMTWSAPGRW